MDKICVKAATGIFVYFIKFKQRSISMIHYAYTNIQYIIIILYAEGDFKYVCKPLNKYNTANF